MTGVVLCGGQSTRMGTDKGLLQWNGKTWAQHAVDKLSSLQIPVVVSVNKNQLESYSKIFTTEQLIADDEGLSLKGPLLGLMSVHQKLGEEDLFVLGCDMVEMNIRLLQDLIAHCQGGICEAYVYTTDEKPQPLCGIYTAAASNKIYKLYQQQQLKRFSMMYALKCIDTTYVPVPKAMYHCFTNYNSPEDLKAWTDKV